MLISKRSRDINSDLVKSALVLFRHWFVLGYLGFMLMVLYPAYKLGAWEPGLWKATAFWLLLAGFGLFFKFSESIREPGFFKRAIVRAFGIVAVVEFVANLSSFPLWIEVPAQPVLFVCIVFSSLPARKSSEVQNSKLADGIVWIYGLGALAWGFWRLGSDWSVTDQGDLAREFLLPVWLTAIALFYIYGLWIYSTYELAFAQMQSAEDERSLLKRRLAIILRTGARPKRLRILDRAGGWRFANTSGFKDAWNEVGRIILADRERTAAERAIECRLVENAGVAGIDSGGKQLDQREHRETREALRWLAVCQMGHYRRNNRYHKESFAAVVANLSERYGLPTPNGIRLHVSGNGQRWYADRETITGHWFAIGAAAPPSDQWLYDGTQPPNSYPEESEWDQWIGGTHAVNWD